MEGESPIGVDEAQKLALTPDECATQLLSGVKVDEDPKTGTTAFFNGLYEVVTTLCVGAGVDDVSGMTMWDLVTRTQEITVTELSPDLLALQPVLSKPLNGDVLTVMDTIGVGKGRPLSEYVSGLPAQFSPEKDVASLEGDI